MVKKAVIQIQGVFAELESELACQGQRAEAGGERQMRGREGLE
jgi:hypothetical protein